MELTIRQLLIKYTEYLRECDFMDDRKLVIDYELAEIFIEENNIKIIKD